MHRAIEITVPSEQTDTLIEELKSLEHVIGLSVLRGASVKPEGDIIVVNALNRGADDVMRLAQRVKDERHASVSLVTAELASIIDPPNQRRIKDDIDEELWEEMETGLRHQSHLTVNFLLLMATGGAISSAGLVSDPVPQATAWIAASVIAPAFEPISKIPLGMVLRNRDVMKRGLISLAVGYLVLMLASALMFLVLRWAGEASVQDLVGNIETQRILTVTWRSTLVSACAALAGITISAAYREFTIAGPVIALVLIPTAATVGAGLVGGQYAMAYAALVRLGLDALLIIVLSALFIFWKQKRVHRRSPMV
jgi:hypothetical protein